MRKITAIFISLALYIPAAAATIYVNWDGTGDYTTIQEGINAAHVGDTVIVAPGTYYENIRINGKDIILTSSNPADPIVVGDTIIDGGGSGKVVTLSNSQTSACELTGFTITNGYSSGVGGGICGYGTNATISECIITGNTAIEDGGGIYYCNGVITNCTIAGNTVYDDGGGLYYCNGSITNCTITGNTASYGGGLYYCNGSIMNCTITGNSATRNGGGMYFCDGEITNCAINDNTANRWGGGLISCNGSIMNCTITGNTATYGAGLYYCNGSITNCTITGNSATRSGDGLSSCDGTITNCIIWGNSGVQLYNSSTPTYSCIQGWTGGGIGNISSDPLFVDEASNDYHLQALSSCIDAGTNFPPGGLPATDLDGNPRIINAVVDMGVYEVILPSIPSAMNFTPQTLNCSSEGNWVKAHFTLPEGYTIEDVDTDKPATIDSLTILSEHMNVSYNDEGLVEIEVAFSRNDFCSIGLFGNIKLTVRGFFTDGTGFHGTDTIRITTNQLEKLPEFLSYWLQTDCVEPDLCNGFDLDRNGTVNLADFVLLAEN